MINLAEFKIEITEKLKAFIKETKKTEVKDAPTMKSFESWADDFQMWLEEEDQTTAE